MDHDRQAFVHRMGHAAETDGLSPIAGRLFGLLLLSDAPHSLDEIAASLEVSKASVSTEARRLLERRIVERVSVPGDRRDYYELAPDFFAEVIRARVDHWRRFHESIESVRGTPVASIPVVRRRLASIDDIHSFVVHRVDAALEEWERRAKKTATRPTAHRRRTA